jgi:hypothetical protein
MFHAAKSALAAAAIVFSVSTVHAQSMSTPQTGAAAAGFGRIATPAPTYDVTDNSGFTSLFDGTLKGWGADPTLWDINDGSIHISASCEKPTGTVYAVSDTGNYGDFILKYDMKGTGSINGGMQFRSYITSDTNVTGGPKMVAMPRPAAPTPAAPAANAAPRAPRPAACANPGKAPSHESQVKWDMEGPQADFDANNSFSGMNYEQHGRAVISIPGYSIYADQNGSWAVAKIADKATLDSWFHKNDWNQFMVVVVGHSTSIYMNGHLVTQLIDFDPKYFRSSGKIGVESENTGDLWVKNIYIKKL